MNNGGKVLHIITRLILGGAQENTLYTVEGLMKDPVYDVTLASGPTTGPEGSLVSKAKGSGVNLVIINSLTRNINPFRDVIAFLSLYKLIKINNYDIVHTHSSKAGILGRFAAKLAGCSVIIHTIHGLPFHPYQNKFLNFFYIHMEEGGFSDWVNQLKGLEYMIRRGNGCQNNLFLSSDNPPPGKYLIQRRYWIYVL